MKRLISLTIAFCISLGGLSVPAAQADDYSIPCSGGGSVPVVGTHLYQATSDCAGSVVVPAEITELVFSFRFRELVTNVTFEEGSVLQAISSYAFENSAVTTISFPSSLDVIWYNAFYGSSLTSISIPSTIKRVLDGSFEGSKITTVIVEPRTDLLQIGNSAFENTPLESITFKSRDQITESPFILAKKGFNFQYWSTSDGGSAATYPVSSVNSDITLFAIFQPKLVQIFNCSVSGTFTTTDTILTSSSNCTGEAQVPSFVTEINGNVFGYSPISKIVIPSTTKVIGAGAFYDSALESIEFEAGSTLGTIAYGAFFNCKNLTDFSLPASVTYISDDVFGGSGLEHFTFEGPQEQRWWFANNWLGKNQLRTLTFGDARGTIVSPGQPRRVGNTFEGFSTSDGGSALEFPYSVGELTEITLYAKWAPDTYAVTYDSSGGTAVDPGQVVGGEITSPPTPPTREGHTFAGWKRQWYEPNVVSFPYTVTEDGALTLYASWRLDTVDPATNYQVTFDTQGGSWTDIMNVGGAPLASFNSMQPLVFGTGPFTAVREGYTFDGWSTTANGTPISFPYAPGVLENITLYALWTSDAIFREVNFDSKGGSAVEASTFTEGGELDSAPEAPSRSGYTFVGWSATDGGNAITFPYTPGVSADITLYAKWTANTFTVALDTKGGSVVAPVSFVTGGQIGSAPSAPNRTGYNFAGWSATDGGNAITFPYSPGVMIDITLYAKWTLKNVKAAATVKPTISGTARLKAVLKVKSGTWTGSPTPKIAYQWYSCTKAVSAATASIPKTCKAISGKTASSLALATTYKGKFVAVRVTGTSTGTTGTSWLSKSTTAVK